MRNRVLIASAALVLGACQKGGTTAAKSGTFKAMPGDTTEVVAGIDTMAITKGMINQALTPSLGQIAQQAQSMGGDIDLVLKYARQQLVSQMLFQHILTTEIQKQNIQAPAAKVDSVFGLFRKQFPDEAKFEQFLQSRNLDLPTLKSKLSEQLKADILIEKELSDSLKVSDEEVQAYFEANKARYGVGGQVKASHILKLAKGADTAEAFAAISAVQKKLAAGADFAAIATAESQDPGSAQKGGDLGFFDPKDMVPAFSAALATLKPGQVSGLVRSEFGYHIIKLIEKREGKEVKLDSLKPSIVAEIQGMRKEQLGQQYMRKMLKAAKITFLNDDYKSTELFGGDKKGDKKSESKGGPKQPGLITKLKK